MMKGGKEAQKEKILEVLKKHKKMSSSQVGVMCGIGSIYLMPLLKELEKEGKIKSEKAGELATYWELK